MRGLLVVVAFLLAGCGSQGPAQRTAMDLADELGCTGGTPDDYATACEFKGTRLNIRSFADPGERDAYVVAAANFANVLVGDNFVVEAPDTATLNQARKILGGEVMGCGDVAGCSAPQ